MIENGVKIFYMRVAVQNQRGQAAIFVALMFNVLFVFFAMSINVALVVHDKINLQNSSDLAAYYAAAKQAEILNVIAHENYMIRQSWKLLAWRYHVLGTMGLDRGATTHPTRTGDISENIYQPAVKPSVCVSYRPTWLDVPKDENLCNHENLHIPPLPQVQVVAGFLGLNMGIAALSAQLRIQFNASCANLGAYNWWFAMSMFHAFRLDQRNRKQVIYALAKDLAGTGNGDFIDLDGNSVLAGARETFIKNLTFANRQAFEASGGEFKMMNSFTGLNPTQWLVEIKTIPTVVYTDVDNTSGCTAIPSPIQTIPRQQDAKNVLNAPLPNGLNAGKLILWSNEKFLEDSDYQFSMGVEKNPWYLPYIGVQASASPRQIFFPLGSGVPMSARSFAKPFGGRIGPWFQSTWQSGAQTSSGKLTDVLSPPRVAAGGLMNDPNDPRRLPNYSRYPGDKKGLGTALGVNSLSGLAKLGIHYEFYKNIAADIVPGGPNDVLAWDAVAGGVPDVRNYEISAIVPDLFDITYYSIEANFSKNYYERLLANRQKLAIPFSTPIRPDIGQSPLAPQFSIQDQLELARSKGLQRPESYYFIRNKIDLLTSWLPGAGAFNYEVSAAMENFGKCAVPDDTQKSRVPGSCVAGGGRTGYSVKLLARDALFSNQHHVGGPGAGAGPILNPPQTGSGW